MYVATFYSFKGGVGRSMALVNVAADLTRRGKRVMIVDFDLEAPGLDTFDITVSKKRKRGLLDFVCDYRDTASVPDVRDYVYQTGLNFGPGQLWVMPAGLQDQEYQNRFRSLDWADLYARQHGFLLFEDLKAQWRDSLGLEYVLIDSRTGHTDVAGICTRQLPNAVVTFFFPNEQNRRGLQSIVSQIREESKGPLKKKIDLHFVMSNVPDLDDEEEILENEMRRFEESLGFDSPSAVIHHYDSLALLEQVTFTIKRPRSRLAKEYRRLALTIVRKNLEDRIGALAYLEFVSGRARTGAGIPDLEVRLQEVRLTHSQDAEVLGKLAAVRGRQRKNEEALAILTQALSSGVNEPDLFLRRAQVFVSLGQGESAVADVKQALANPNSTAFDLGVSIRMLREIQPDSVYLISQSPALDHLEPDVDFVRELEASPETLSLAVRLMSRWLQNTKDQEIHEMLQTELILCLIGKGSYQEALSLFGRSRVNPDTLDTRDSFNYAMALWGLEGTPPLDFLLRLAESTKDFANSKDPNNLQCFSLVNRMIGQVEVANELLAKARETNLKRGASSFSCWSYLKVSVAGFTNDLEEMQNSFLANKVIPEFVRRNSSESSDEVKQPGSRPSPHEDYA
jgi:MinD-like ATPase involved in chromosome partitioning or flagellar assembly